MSEAPYYGMYTNAGNARVHEIVLTASLLPGSYPQALKALERLSQEPGFENGASPS